MKSKPIGLARGRYVEATTKSGNTISGTFRRVDKDEILYLVFDFRKKPDDEPMQVTATAALDDIDTLIIGSKEDAESDDDTGAEATELPV